MILLVASWTSLGQPRSTITSSSGFVIRDVTIVNVLTGLLEPSSDIEIERGRIKKIGRHLKVARGVAVVDGRNKFLIPGLWDMHVHIFNNAHNPDTDNHSLYFPLLLANGVTGVRDMWTDEDDLKVVSKWRIESEAGRMLAPRIAPSSDIVDGVPTFLPNMAGVSTPEEGRQKVRDLKRAGAGFIKVYWRLSPSVYAAIADEAKKLNIVFAGHVPFAVSAIEASNAGQKSIEHMTGILETCSSKEEELRSPKGLKPWEITDQLWRTYNDEKCQKLFRVFSKNHTSQVPTVVLHRMLAYRREESFTKDVRLDYVDAAERNDWLRPPTEPVRFPFEVRKQRFEKLEEVVATMHRLGVPILAGTDLGNPWIFAGFSLHDELELFVQGGLTPLQALRTATIHPARYLGLDAAMGTVERGKVADLVLLDANPLERITNTKRIDAVIVNGRFLSRTELDEMLADARKVASGN